MTEQAIHTTSSGSEARHRTFWVGLVLSLLGGQIAFVCVMVYMATTNGSFAIEPNYYQKGLHWDATAAQLRENDRLSWSVGIDVGDDVGTLGERIVTCTLRNKDELPLEGAIIDLVAFPHVRGQDRTLATLVAEDGGRYQTTLRFSRKGLWEFRGVVKRGPDTFTFTQQQDVYPPGESRPWRR